MWLLLVSCVCVGEFEWWRDRNGKSRVVPEGHNHIQNGHAVFPVTMLITVCTCVFIGLSVLHEISFNNRGNLCWSQNEKDRAIKE